jgi:hypothetical protein
MNIEDKIKEFLDIHFDLLKTESGSSVTENVKQAALMQVLLYWRRLKHVAKNVTETEVKLSLPNQSTSQKRKYGIDAVVDIVQTDQETIMYDFKTHDKALIKGNIEIYSRQLSIYMMIWNKTRKDKKIDRISIISTPPDDEIEIAYHGFNSGLINEKEFDRALKNWDPIINLEYSTESIEKVKNEFSEVVDKIESHQFAPRPYSEIIKVFKGTSDRSSKKEKLFLSFVCVNCDARFSCSSFRK